MNLADGLGFQVYNEDMSKEGRKEAKERRKEEVTGEGQARLDVSLGDLKNLEEIRSRVNPSVEENDDGGCADSGSWCGEHMFEGSQATGGR